MAYPKKPSEKFANVSNYLKEAFDVVTNQFLPKDGKSLNFGFSLSDIYRSSTEAHGGIPDPQTESSLIEVAEAYLEASRKKTEAALRHALQTHEKHTKDNSQDDSPVEEAVESAMDKATIDINRIVEAESQRARSTGAWEGTVQVAAKMGIDDPTVGWYPVKDSLTCEECIKLHLMPDGVTPRVWKLSEVSKDYHKKGENRPSIQNLHPHCRCSIFTLLPNYGFNHNGQVVYKYVGYDEYSRQRGVEEELSKL